MITKEEFVLLYEKDLLGQCTPEEKELLESFHDEILMPDDKWEPHLGDKKNYIILNITISTKRQYRINI